MTVWNWYRYYGKYEFDWIEGDKTGTEAMAIDVLVRAENEEAADIEADSAAQRQFVAEFGQGRLVYNGQWLDGAVSEMVGEAFLLERAGAASLFPLD